MTLDTALWIGEAGNCLADGTPLVPGQTVAFVPAGEAQTSDLWSPLGTPLSDSGPGSEFDGGGPTASDPLGLLDGGTP